VSQPAPSDIALRPNLPDSDVVALTRRQYLAKATAGASCGGCHVQLNEIGFATGQYDSVGRFAAKEQIYNSSNVWVAEHTVDPSTQPAFSFVDTRTFATLDEFQTGLASSELLQSCLTTKAFEFFDNGTEDLTLDGCRLNAMDTQLKQAGSLQAFLVQYFKHPSLLYRRSN
jgi:hypothetical protein